MGNEAHELPTFAQQIEAHILVLLLVDTLLYGLLAPTANVEVPKLLLAVAGTAGFDIDYLGIPPKVTQGHETTLLLFLALLFRWG